MALPKKAPDVVDKALIKALAHPIRNHILDILSEGPSTPGKMQRRMPEVSLNLVSYHVKALLRVGAIELIDVRKKGNLSEHVYRTKDRQFFTQEEWDAVEPELRSPITAQIMRVVSEDIGRALVEGKFDQLPDNHISRSPLELDKQGWNRVSQVLADALDEILEAHDESKQRAAYGSSKGKELMTARVIILQFPIGAEIAASVDGG